MKKYFIILKIDSSPNIFNFKKLYINFTKDYLAIINKHPKENLFT